ncbi:MAG: MBL fold metallo-hydrolase [Verrucomicrobiae bacterium]|jgi:glyoxylase-like metal-dependent hydrolase (beta-lactamase superfamily II)|nr:MBL fold metallo-hydrolase [Verrucomicrobiae bacterium]
MKNITCFTGGPVDTHSYLVSLPEGNLLIDAPEGSAAYFKEAPINLLVLTHGHFDHVMDAAKIVREHHCPVMMHRITEEIVADTGLLRRLGLDFHVEPVKASQYLVEGPHQLFLGHSFDIFEVPGHCPGSICFYDAAAGLLYGGDVLFAGGVGRWDLPGGDRELLLDGIQKKLLPLPPQTRVFAGHGAETTIGHEAETNPYLR